MRSLIVQWNNKWRYDFWFRQKYNIPFNSPAHREISQIDIRFMRDEEKLIQGAVEERKEKEEKIKYFKQTGSLFAKEGETQKEKNLFDKIQF